jgi:hypothetical protein
VIGPEFIGKGISCHVLSASLADYPPGFNLEIAEEIQANPCIYSLLCL